MTQRARFLALLLLLSLPALAQLPRNEISGSTGWAHRESAESSQVTGASYNRFWTDVLSTRIGGLAATKDFTAVHVSMELHFFRDRLVSPWAGGGIAVPRVSDSEFSPILGGGLDFKISRNWAIGGEVLHTRHTVDQGTRFERDTNPITSMLSVRRRF